MIQGDQLNMAVFLWYLVKSDMSSVSYCTQVHWTGHFFFKGNRNTRLCLTGHPVDHRLISTRTDIIDIIDSHEVKENVQYILFLVVQLAIEA